MSIGEARKQRRSLGLPARAAAVAAAMVQAIVAAAISRLGLVAAGKLTAEEASELESTIAAACRAAFTAGSSTPRREHYGALDGDGVFVRLSSKLARAVSREASNARVSIPCWLRWAASEQLRLERSPLEPGEQERMAAERKSFLS